MTGRLRIPAEWERHEACWLGFPHLAVEWPGTLRRAQRSIADLCRAIAGPGRELVRLLVRDEQVEATARALIGDMDDVEYVRAEYGDSWLRDTAPLFGFDENGALGALRFDFNCWGGKYTIPFDDVLGDRLAERLQARLFRSRLTLEGGALEFDGRGTFLTTESCVLNENRNPGLSREAFEESLRELLAIERLVWLEGGLPHDHTDGHIDMIARFCAPSRVVCMRPEKGAPNAEVLGNIVKQLRDAGFEIVELPPAPALRTEDGAPLPGSYCNFYVANGAVIVPTYGVREDSAVLERIAEAFPGREVVGLPAYDLLCGGGAFHCVTQPQPASA